jgi:hypothetical protein
MRNKVLEQSMEPSGSDHSRYLQRVLKFANTRVVLNGNSDLANPISRWT